jgi:hypothetical protein
MRVQQSATPLQIVREKTLRQARIRRLPAASRMCWLYITGPQASARPARRRRRRGYTVFDVSVRRPWRLSRYPRRTYRQGEDGMDSRRAVQRLVNGEPALVLCQPSIIG